MTNESLKETFSNFEINLRTLAHELTRIKFKEKKIKHSQNII